MTRPLWYAVAAYVVWGFFPLYFRFLRHVPTGEAMGHRIVWAAALLGVVLLVGGRLKALTAVSRKVVGLYALAAVLVGANWTLYVWAINAGYVIQTSLGYFILPLINVLLGVVVLRERLRRLQWVAVATAAAGVAYLTIAYAAPPWIALGLATSFAAYGFIKKKAPLAPLEGLFLETAILSPVALMYLMLVQRRGEAMFLHDGVGTDLLLAGIGFLTIVPLALFAAAVRRAPLSIVGILQYISPTIQFLIGLWVFDEAFSTEQLIGFTLVWAAIGVFALDGLMAHRPVPPAPIE